MLFASVRDTYIAAGHYLLEEHYLKNRSARPRFNLGEMNIFCFVFPLCQEHEDDSSAMFDEYFQGHQNE